MKKEYVLKFCHPQITIQEESKEDFKKLMENIEKDDKWMLPLLFIVVVAVFIFFILVITGNLHRLFELFGG